MTQLRAGSVGVYQRANPSNHILKVEHKYRYYCKKHKHASIGKTNTK